MAYVERSDGEIIAAWKDYCKRHPNRDRVSLQFGDKTFTPRQLAAALEKGDDPDLKAVFVDNVRACAKRLGVDILELFSKKRQPREDSSGVPQVDTGEDT